MAGAQRFYSTVDLVNALEQEKAQGTAGRIELAAHGPRHPRRAGLSALQPGRPGAAVPLLSKLYEHTSVMITTSQDFAAWSSVFGDAKMTKPYWIGSRTTATSWRRATRAIASCTAVARSASRLASRREVLPNSHHRRPTSERRPRDGIRGLRPSRRPRANNTASGRSTKQA